MSVLNSIINEDLTLENRFIASFVWISGTLASSFYNLQTMEMFVTHEAIDLRPEYSYLHNLFRQMPPEYAMISGPTTFVKEVMGLMNMDEDADPKDYRKTKKTSITSRVVIFSHEEPELNQNKRRVKDISLPGMPQNLTDSERSYFLESVLPLNETLVVHSLGNLIQYLELNWKRLFLNDSKPIISDLRVFYMESQLIMDNTTFHALQIFTPLQHPSGFKNGDGTSTVEGFSLYGLFHGKCCSNIGSRELKLILHQPIRDICEINIRLSTIDWCLKQENAEILTKLKKFIKKLTRIHQTFAKIVVNGGKPAYWKSLLVCVFNAYSICEIAKNLNEDDIRNTFLFDLANVLKTEHSQLENIFEVLDSVVDIEESEKQEKFVVQSGLDKELDRKKNEMLLIQAKLYEVAKVELNNLPEFVKEFTVTFMPGFGFVIGIPTWGSDISPKSFETDTLIFVFNAHDTAFYKTNQCKELDEKYGHLYSDISEHEKRMCDRLIKVLYEHLPELEMVVRLCAKLDCMIAMAETSYARNYTRPIITTEKTIEIKDGRHPLLEGLHNFVSNDTLMGIENKNLLTILNAPNSSGKSVYLRQIAMIAYLAHIGCYVPATYAKIYLLDGIYSRIYSPESTYYGTSSFLWDLQQMGKVMMNSSNRSLILLDEFGKGTNLDEGRAILIGCLDSLIGRGDAIPIIILSTHYPDIYSKLKSKNYVSQKTIAVCHDEERDTITSTYKIIDGCCSGIYATRLPETKKFIDELLTDSLSSTFLKHYDNITQNMLFRSRIKFAYDVLRTFLENNNQIDYKVFKDMLTKAEMNGTLN